MSAIHGDIVCKKFLENKYSFGTKCMFSHSASPVQNNRVLPEKPQFSSAQPTSAKHVSAYPEPGTITETTGKNITSSEHNQYDS